MSKKLSKTELKMHRDAKEKIDSDAKPNDKTWFSRHNPIYIPKRKKKK